MIGSVGSNESLNDGPDGSGEEVDDWHEELGDVGEVEEGLQVVVEELCNMQQIKGSKECALLMSNSGDRS